MIDGVRCLHSRASHQGLGPSGVKLSRHQRKYVLRIVDHNDSSQVVSPIGDTQDRDPISAQDTVRVFDIQISIRIRLESDWLEMIK